MRMLSRVVFAATLVARILAAPTASSSSGSSGHEYITPSLSGPHCVGKLPVQVLTDYTRKDTFANDTNAPRSILVQLYYPVKKKHGQKECPGEAYASPGFSGWISNQLSGNVSAEYFQKFKSHSVTNAPFYDCGAPLLLYSHGFGVPAKLNQLLVEDVVSHGYMVALMEHPWDSDYAEFPDGHVVRTAPIFFQQTDFFVLGKPSAEVRVEDTLFLLKEIRKGRLNPHGKDISKLANHCGMFGHSVGGQQSLLVMLRTQAVIAGINMDGWFWNAANATNLTNPHTADVHRPYMTLRQDPDLLTEFYLTTGGGPANYVNTMKVQSGPKVMPLVKGILHWGYTDLTALSIPAQDHGTQKEITAFQTWIGPGNPRRLHLISCTYNRWFFDNTPLKGGHEDISKGYKPPFPEVTLADNIGN